jgi:hypothetical protein
MRATNRRRRCVLYLVCWRDLTIGRLLHKNELGIQWLSTDWRQQSFVLEQKHYALDWSNGSSEIAAPATSIASLKQCIEYIKLILRTSVNWTS